MRLAVINDWFSDKLAAFTNKDGFLKSLQVLQERDGWEVVFFKKSDAGIYKNPCVEMRFSDDPKKAALEWKPDAVLFFCDFSRPILEEFRDVKIPKAMCFTGGPYRDFEDVPDIVFVESAVYFDEFKARGLNVRRAFGTNMDMFKPMKQPKIFDAVFPATFAAWKRHTLFAEAMGSKGLACGFWQPHEQWITDKCQELGVTLLHHQMAESTNLVYNMGRTCVITSDSTGGSQRTVLEAMACNIPVIVMADSDKCREYVEACGVGAVVEPNVDSIRKAVDEWKDKEVNTRDWIEKNYSHNLYATQLKDGIESIL